MVFNSFSFLIFFPIVLGLYRVLPKRARWVMLLAASYYFYLSWQPDLIYLIMFTTAVSYFCAIGIEKTSKKGLKKLFLVTAVVASLSVLFFFKYFNFLSQNITALLNLIRLPVGEFTLNLILPVGISFYTFQTLSYVIDVYREKMPAERHFGYYALYVSYFPQLVAGPIERPENLLPQLRADNPFTAADTAAGLKMMAVGFFKKIAVADRISCYVDAVYGSAGADSAVFNGFTVLLATCLFAVQIYCDFSGYTDIAIGCARVMGIRLMQNFNAPYSATSIKGFWRRWHISLTSWFTDYIYIPLGGSRVARGRHYGNIFFVFLISGIWHGAAWTYVLWGVMHGVYQIVGNLTEKPRSALYERLRIDQNSSALLWWRRLCTFALVCLAWVAFRADSLSDMSLIYKELFCGWQGIDISSSLRAIELTPLGMATVILSILVLWQMDKQIALKNAEKGTFSQILPARALTYIVICWTIAAAWLILLAESRQAGFIYFQF